MLSYAAVLLAGSMVVGQADASPSDYVYYYSPFLGTWSTVVEVDGEVFHGRTTWRLGANKRCLLVDGESQNTPATQSVQGYDVAAGIWKMARFDSEGRVTQGTLDHTDFKPGKKISVGHVGNWSDTIIEDGRRIRRTSRLSCAKLNEGEVILEWTDVKHDGMDAPSVRFTMKREATPGPDYEHLKQLEWLIGDWEGEMVVPPSFEEIFPEGAMVHTKQSYFWMQNRNYIGFKFWDEVDGKVHHEGFEMVGVDPMTKQLVHWIFSTAGGHGAGDWSLDGKTWRLKWWGVLPSQAKYEGTSYMVSIDADTHTWQIRGLTRNGETVPDYPKVTFRRVEVGNE